MTWFAIGVAVWMAVGVGVAVWQRRRGHHLLTWAVLGLVFGPLTFALAVDAERGLLAAEPDPLAGVGHVGPVDVLIGLDGSDRALAAARSVAGLLGPRMGRCTLVRAIDHETAIDPELGRARHEEALEADRRALGVPGAETAVAVGRPDRVLRELARDHGYDVIVVGATGSGMTERILGSVTRYLASSSEVPVLVGGSGRSAAATPREDLVVGGTLRRPCRSPTESDPTSA